MCIMSMLEKIHTQNLLHKIECSQCALHMCLPIRCTYGYVCISISGSGASSLTSLSLVYCSAHSSNKGWEGETCSKRNKKRKFKVEANSGFNFKHVSKEIRNENLKLKPLLAQKYAHLTLGYLFTLVAIVSAGAIGLQSWAFLKELGRRLRQETGEAKSLLLILIFTYLILLVLYCLLFVYCVLYCIIRESVDSLCRDGADTPIVRVHWKAFLTREYSRFKPFSAREWPIQPLLYPTIPHK